MSDQHFPVVGVGVVVLNENNDVLLIRRGIEPNIGMWTIPGGRQKPGETLVETAYREIQEETGVSIEEPQLIDVVDLIRHNDDQSLLRHYTLIDYAARFKDGIARPGGDADDVEWIPLTDVENRITWSETIRIIREAVRLISSK